MHVSIVPDGREGVSTMQCVFPSTWPRHILKFIPTAQAPIELLYNYVHGQGGSAEEGHAACPSPTTPLLCHRMTFHLLPTSPRRPLCSRDVPFPRTAAFQPLPSRVLRIPERPHKRTLDAPGCASQGTGCHRRKDAARGTHIPFGLRHSPAPRTPLRQPSQALWTSAVAPPHKPGLE